MTLIRPISPEDRQAIETWIAGEPSHPNNTFEFYTESGCKSVVSEDEEGGVMVTRFTPCLRVDIDFNPEASPSRIGKAIASGLKDMAEQAKAQGFKEFVFESSSPKLVVFCERLGYASSPDYRKRL